MDEKKEKKSILKKWWFWVIIAVIVIAALGNSNNETTKNVPDYTGSNDAAVAGNGETTEKTSETTDKKKNNKYTLGDTFTFDDLELTVGTSVTYDTVKNQFSEYNGAEVIVLPVTIKNLKDETHSLNTFYVDYFGSKGTELDTVDYYFDAKSITNTGDLRTGASVESVAYLIYDGNGTYGIDFNNYREKITLEFNIEK